MTAGLRSRTTVALDDLRVAGALMLAAAAVRPALPGQPGLPCPLRTLTGIPCPLCGMTTSVTALVHLHAGQALAANPAGLVVVPVALALLAFRHVHRVTLPSWWMPAALALMWAYQLARFRIV
ncbi:MAG: DUF2752 domain-containing protein [Actinobacteria bacterium]|nr:DUF2752 domain-containing protein [Actinomycetota bacterium]